MKVDLYTRVVLTVIAIALSVLAVTEVVALFSPSPAQAKGAAMPTKVTICSEKGDFCAMVDETSRLMVK